MGPAHPRGDHNHSQILAALPESEGLRLQELMTPHFLGIKTVLFEPGEPIDAVYFPLDGVVSLVTPLEDGAIVEVATIGNEGIVALFGQIAQAAACNRLHSNEERLSRWLLMSHDRVGADEFAITHEFLGQMLGSRRATVTLSAGILQAAGLIRYQRGHVTIVDRAGLEGVSCECYGVIKQELDRVVRGRPSSDGH